MADEETIPAKEDESVIVRGWRLESFLALGFGLREASMLMKRPDIEIRKAEKLIESGATHEVALRILL